MRSWFLCQQQSFSVLVPFAIAGGTIVGGTGGFAPLLLAAIRRWFG